MRTEQSQTRRRPAVKREPRRLSRVDAAEERLPEVGQQRAGEAADEPFVPTTPVDAAHGDHLRRALEDMDAATAQRRHELLMPVRVPVVVPQRRVDRDADHARHVREHSGLFGLAVGRQVAGEQDQVALALGVHERGLEPRPLLLGAVDVAPATLR